MRNPIENLTWLGTLFAGMVLASTNTLCAATDTWTGGAAPSGNWSAGANWFAGTAPSPFDSLVFTNLSGTAESATNDLAGGTPFYGLTFGSSSAGSTFTLAGDGILLTGATNGSDLGVAVASGNSQSETVNLSLTNDWGYYTFNDSGGGSLAINSNLVVNLGGMVYFGSGVTSSSLTPDANGLITGLDGNGVFATNTLSLLPLATISGGSIVPLPIGSYTVVASGAIASAPTANVELNGTTTTAYTDSSATVNTITTDKNTGNSGGSQTITVTTTGTLTLGSKGGIYVTGSGSGDKQIFKLTGGNLTAGASGVGGSIVLGINGTSTGNQMQLDSTVINNGSGPVTLIKTGPGSMYIDKANTYSGGTYVIEGYLQLNGATEAGTGPIYIASGATLFPNTASTTWANNMFISPGLGATALAAGIGAIKMGNGANPQALTGTLTLLGSPTTTAPGDRISGTGSGGNYSLAGQITGGGTLELISEVATANFIISNKTANANNWTGGLIIDGNSGDSCYTKLGFNNQLAGNNVIINQAGAGTCRLDLNGFSDTIGSLSGVASANNQVADFGGAPSVLTIGAGNGTATFSGVIGGDSPPNTLSIVKIGNGTETLNAADTYQGNTLVEGGTLALAGSGSLETPLIMISNATFDVSGAASYSGNASIGMMSNATFNVGNLIATVSGGLAISNSTLVFPLSESSAAITVSGTFATGGGTNTISLTSLPGFGSYPQQFPLIRYGSADPNLVDVNNNLTALGVALPAGGSFIGYPTNNTSDNSIDLVLVSGPVTPVEPITWSGETNGVNVGNWDILTTSNWVLTADGVTPYYYEDTAPVTFDDSVRGTTIVNLKKTLLPGSITLNNNNSNYVFSGTGKISGTTSLINNGSGTLTLTETGGDNFSGGITVNNGMVVVDNNSGGINGGITINAGTVQVGNSDANGVLPGGGITDDGALVFSRTDTALTVANVISGTGNVTNNGIGTVTITGIDSYTGATVVNAGTLALNGPNGTTSTISTSSELTINNTATVLVEADNSLGNTTTALPITINTGGVLTGLGTADGGTGTSSHLRGPLTLSGGILGMNGSQTATHGSWDLDGGVLVPGTPITSTISALNVVPSQTPSTTFNVNSGGTPSGIDLLVSGTLNNASAEADTGIIKEGNGVMDLDNNNSFSHGTVINNGTLQLGLPGDTAALITPLGPAGTAFSVTIYSNAVLKFASSKGVTVGVPIADDGTGTVLSSSGTNILTQINTYTGNTFVTGGDLVLAGAGAIDTTTNIVVANAELDISGALSPLDNGGNLLLSNATFNLGANLVSSIGNLAVTNATLAITISAGTFTNISVTNLFVSGGNTNVVVLTAVPGYQYYPTNLPLIQYGSFVNVDGRNNPTNLGLSLPTAGSPVGYLTNDVANNSIDLVLLSDTLVPIYPLLWTGLSNGVPTSTWDILRTPDWLAFGLSGNIPNYPFQNSSAVAFDDSSATQTVNLTMNVAPSVLAFSNNVYSYSLIGTSAIAGAASIMKVGTAGLTLTESGGDSFSNGVYALAGTLVLSNANANVSGGLTVGMGASLTDEHSGTIAGGLTNNGVVLLDQSGVIAGNSINEGSVQVGNNDALGSLPTGSFEDDGVLVFDRSDAALGVGSVISGGGSITNAGTGTVTLNVTETFTGTVVVNAGMLVMNAGNNAAPNGISQASQLIINNGGSVGVLVDNSLAGHGAVQGTLPITINAGGTLTGAPGADAGVGTSTHLPGVVTLNGGTLANSGTSINAANGSWDLDDEVDTAGGPVTAMMTALDLVASAPNGTTFDVIAGTTPSGIDLEVTGNFIHSTGQPDTGIIKDGDGTMVLDNNSTYTNNTTVNGGTLQLGLPTDTNAITEPMGVLAGLVTLNGAGTILAFDGHVGVTVSNVISDDNLGDALVLVNSGTNSLTAANIYTAPTVVSNGTLIVKGSLSTASTVTVVHGTLGGNGTVGGNITNSGTIAPGTASTIGTLTCSSGVLNNGTATSLMKLNTSLTPSNDVLNVTGTLTYGGTLKVVSLGGTYFAGETFQLFSAGTYAGTFSATNLAPPAPGYGLTWNGANGTVTVIQTVNTNPTNIVAAVSGNTLNLSWPADHTGWRLLVQTNSLGSGLNPNPTAWVALPGSASVNSENITMDPTQGTVFYRLVFP